MRPARPKPGRETARTIAFVKGLADSRKLLEQSLAILRKMLLDSGSSTRGLRSIERDLEQVARQEQAMLRSCAKQKPPKRRPRKSG